MGAEFALLVEHPASRIPLAALTHSVSSATTVTTVACARSADTASLLTSHDPQR